MEAIEFFALDPTLDVKVPTSWAICYVDPNEFNPKAADGAKGGHLIPCQRSPVMSAFDRNGNAWVAQDKSDSILFIEAKRKHTSNTLASFLGAPTNTTR